MDTQIHIDYVNERNGNRPPSLKSADGDYYTLSDEAYQSMVPWAGQDGLISYNVNQRGYRVATHWNGMELPKGQRMQTPQRTTAAPPVVSSPPAKPDFGWVKDETGIGMRTMPTLKEQFVMKCVESWCRHGSVLPDANSVQTAIQEAGVAWDNWNRPVQRLSSQPPSGDVPFNDDVPW